MDTNNTNTHRYFAEVFFRSKSGNPCTFYRYMDGKDYGEVYESMVSKVKRIKYFDRVDKVDIVKMQPLDK